MQEHALGFAAFRIIDFVAENWALNEVHMDAQLMGAAGFWFELD